MVSPLSSPPSTCHPSQMTLMCHLVALMVMFIVFPSPHSCLAPAIFKFKLFEYSIFSFFPLWLVRVFCTSPLFSSDLCCRPPGSIAHLACEAQPPQSSLSTAVMHKSWVSC